MSNSEVKDSLVKRFKEELDQISWIHLLPHHERGVVIILHSSLDLIETACAVALDDKGSIERWLSEGLLRKPDEKEAEAWQKEYTVFECLIVQPFVLAKLH